jgi:hypothetical protein
MLHDVDRRAVAVDQRHRRVAPARADAGDLVDHALDARGSSQSSELRNWTYSPVASAAPSLSVRGAPRLARRTIRCGRAPASERPRRDVRGRVRRAVVDDDDLEVAPGLREGRRDRALDVARMVVRRHDDAHARPRGTLRRAPRLKHRA